MSSTQDDPQHDNAKTVLIAEDEPDIRELATVVLGRAGYRTSAYADGEAALEAALADPPDLCLLDVMMPRRSGFEVLRALREDDRTREIRAIICTATIQDEREVRAGSPTADAYLRKPFSNSDLLGTVERLLG